MTADERQRLGIAAHEAGHAVIVAIYGATVERACLADDGADGECTFTADSFGATARAYRPLIAAARAVASAVLLYGPRPTLHRIEVQLEGSDREELRLASLLSLQRITAPLSDVLPVVLRCRGAVRALAKELFVGCEISHADVCAALGPTDGGGPGSFELATIRSGCAPSTFTVNERRPRCRSC